MSISFGSKLSVTPTISRALNSLLNSDSQNSIREPLESSNLIGDKFVPSESPCSISSFKEDQKMLPYDECKELFGVCRDIERIENIESFSGEQNVPPRSPSPPNNQIACFLLYLSKVVKRYL